MVRTFFMLVLSMILVSLPTVVSAADVPDFNRTGSGFAYLGKTSGSSYDEYVYKATFQNEYDEVLLDEYVQNYIENSAEFTDYYSDFDYEGFHSRTLKSVDAVANYWTFIYEGSKKVGTIRHFGTNPYQGHLVIKQYTSYRKNTVEVYIRIGKGLSYAGDTGKIHSSNSSNEKHTCISCGGSGRCSQCGGSGRYRMFPTDDSERPCGSCMATGKCPFCNGTGKK